MRLQQLEMTRLFLRNDDPFPIKRLRQIGKPPHRVQRKIDGIELNVRKRVQQNGAPFGRADAAIAQLRGRHQHRLARPARDRLDGLQRCVRVERKLGGHRRQNAALALPGVAGERLKGTLSNFHGLPWDARGLVIV